MATYRSIVGQKIKKVTSDPSNPIEGQMWYNSTVGVLKGQQFTAAAFAAGGTMGTGRYGGQYFGTGKASQVACGGHVPG